MAAPSWLTSCSKRSVGADFSLDFATGSLYGFGDAGFVEWLQDIIYRIYVKGLYSIVIKSRGKDYVGYF